MSREWEWRNPQRHYRPFTPRLVLRSEHGPRRGVDEDRYRASTTGVVETEGTQEGPRREEEGGEGPRV